MTDPRDDERGPVNEDAEHAEWVEVGNYRTGLEAEMAKQLLDAAGIPVLARSDAPGIFGLSFQGAVTGGITLHVPSPEAEHALVLLDPTP